MVWPLSISIFYPKTFGSTYQKSQAEGGWRERALENSWHYTSSTQIIAKMPLVPEVPVSLDTVYLLGFSDSWVPYLTIDAFKTSFSFLYLSWFHNYILVFETERVNWQHRHCYVRVRSHLYISVTVQVHNILSHGRFCKCIMSLLWTFLTVLSEKILFAKIYLDVSKLKLAFTKVLS